MRATVLAAAVALVCGLAVPALAMVPPCVRAGCGPCGPVCAPACVQEAGCGMPACGPRIGYGKGSCCDHIWDGYCSARASARSCYQPMAPACAGPACGGSFGTCGCGQQSVFNAPSVPVNRGVPTPANAAAQSY